MTKTSGSAATVSNPAAPPHTLRNLALAILLALVFVVPTTSYAQGVPIVVKDAIKALRAARGAETAAKLGGAARAPAAAAAITSGSASVRLRAYNPCGGGKSGDCLAKLLGDVQKAGVGGLEGTQIESTLLKAIENAALGKVAETTRLLEEAEGIARASGVALPKNVAAEISDSAFIFSSNGLKALNEGELKIFRELAYADPTTKARIADVLGDTDALIKSVGNVGAKALEERLVWVPLASNEGMRRILIRTILDDFATRSTALKAALKSAPRSKQGWDVVYIGAGPHSASAANALAKANPMASQLVIDAEDVVSANFFKGGRTFAINSSNRAEVAGVVAKPGGTANINPIEGPIGIPDLSGLKYPEGRTIADASTVALSSSRADVLFQSRVKMIAEAPAGSPARYVITIDSGVAGVSQVYANKVVLSTGLGKEFTAIGDAASKRLIASEIGKVNYAAPNEVPGIITFDQFKRLADLSKSPRDPYRSVERIAVVGLGDSGRVTNEFLLGEGPLGGYDGLGTLDRAQRGPVAAIDWIVGSEGPKNATQYSAGIKNGTYPGTRPRYARLTNPIRKADNLIKRGEELGPETVRLVPARLTTIRVLRQGSKRRFKLTYDYGRGKIEEQVVDRVILATGFRSRTGDFLSELLPEEAIEVIDGQVRYVLRESLERSGVLTKVRGEIPGSDKPVFVAKQVPGEDVYFIGPAAGDDLPAKAAKAGISENGASLFNLIPRTTSLARTQLAEGAGELMPVAPKAPKITKIRADGIGEIALDLSGANTLGKLPEGYETFAAKVELAKSIDDLRFAGRSVSLTFSQSGGELILDSSVNAKQMAKALEANGDFIALAKTLTDGGRPVTFTVGVRTKGGAKSGLEKGAPLFDTMTISY